MRVGAPAESLPALLQANALYRGCRSRVTRGSLPLWRIAHLPCPCVTATATERQQKPVPRRGCICWSAVAQLSYMLTAVLAPCHVSAAVASCSLRVCCIDGSRWREVGLVPSLRVLAYHLHVVSLRCSVLVKLSSVRATSRGPVCQPATGLRGWPESGCPCMGSMRYVNAEPLHRDERVCPARCTGRWHRESCPAATVNKAGWLFFLWLYRNVGMRTARHLYNQASHPLPITAPPHAVLRHVG